MAIKEVLREELDSSLRMERSYMSELRKLPKGSLIKKRINGHHYYYLVFRDKGKVQFAYKGKSSREEIAKYKKAKKLRAQFRKHLSQVRKQIRFLQKVLRDRQAI